MKKTGAILLFGAIIFLATDASQAGLIQWDSIINATGNATDVSLSGTLVDSATTFNSSVTLNGVTFNRQTGTSGGVISFANSNITFNNVVNIQQWGDGAPPSWNSEYRNLLRTGAYQASSMEIKIGGLTVGQDYQVQLWAPFWNRNWATGYSDSSSSGGNESGLLDLGIYSEPGFSGQPSQYVLGNFTADSNTQSIWGYTSSGFGTGTHIISALQVRAVPN